MRTYSSVTKIHWWKGILAYNAAVVQSGFAVVFKQRQHLNFDLGLLMESPLVLDYLMK
jgi:hypothetical protein